MLSRNISNRINWILDHLVPPIFRDSRLFMTIPFRLILGPKYHYYMTFKENLHKMSDEEIDGYYKLLAETFISRKTDLNDASIEVILKNILGCSVIDVGCGKGYLIQQIAEHHTAGSRYTGYDVATEPTDTDKIHFVKGSVMSIPFPDKSFDTVVCTHTLEHIRNPEKALRELRRITAKRLIVVVPRQREYKYTFDLHINFYPYLYSFVNFIGNKNARFFECSGDMISIEDVQD